MFNSQSSVHHEAQSLTQIKGEAFVGLEVVGAKCVPDRFGPVLPGILAVGAQAAVIKSLHFAWASEDVAFLFFQLLCRLYQQVFSFLGYLLIY